MLDVISIGGATRDVFLVSDEFIALKSPVSKTGVLECMNLGSKIELDHLVLTTGGGATNAAATFASLGLKVATVCKVGDDAPGRDVVETLKHDGVKTNLVQHVTNGPTGYSTILTMKSGERTVLVHRGVSSKFKNADIPWNKLKAKWLYLTSLGGNLTLSKQIIVFAHKKGMKIAWNPGTGELKKGMSSFKSILPFVDVFNVNKEEAQLLTGERTVKAMLKALHRPEKITVITDGNKGAYADSPEGRVHVGTTKVKSISQTGAGDAFGSGFVTSLIKGKKISSAIGIGILNAESVIQSYGAKNGILSHVPSAKKIKQLPVKPL